MGQLLVRDLDEALIRRRKAQAAARIDWLAGLAVQAAALAVEQQVTTHDALCLALAAQRRLPLVTADRELHDKVLRAPESPRWAAWVGDLPAPRRPRQLGPAHEKGGLAAPFSSVVQ